MVRGFPLVTEPQNGSTPSIGSSGYRFHHCRRQCLKPNSQFALEKRPVARPPTKRKRSSSNHPFNRCELLLLVLGRLIIFVGKRTTTFVELHMFLNFRLQNGWVLPICSLHGGATKNLEKYHSGELFARQNQGARKVVEWSCVLYSAFQYHPDVMLVAG